MQVNEQQEREKINGRAGNNAPKNLEEALNCLKAVENQSRKTLNFCWADHAAFIKVFEHFEEQESLKQSDETFALSLHNVKEYIKQIEIHFPGTALDLKRLVSRVANVGKPPTSTEEEENRANLRKRATELMEWLNEREYDFSVVTMQQLIEVLDEKQPEKLQPSQVKKVLTFADSLDKWSCLLRDMIFPPCIEERKNLASDVNEFANALRKCVEPVEEREQQYKATMYVWNGGLNTALYDDDFRVWLGGFLTVADAISAFGWDFERIEIDRDDLCGNPPPNSLKEMQEHLAGVEKQKTMNRVAILRKELASLEKQLEEGK